MPRSRCFNSPQYVTTGNSGTSPLRAALWLWIGCGLMALLAFPSLRGSSALIGWLPFWLVIAPLIDLALLRRRWLMVASRAFLVGERRRRRRPARQARPLQRRRALRSSPRPLLVNP